VEKRHKTCEMNCLHELCAIILSPDARDIFHWPSHEKVTRLEPDTARRRMAIK